MQVASQGYTRLQAQREMGKMEPHTLTTRQELVNQTPYTSATQFRGNMVMVIAMVMAR